MSLFATDAALLSAPPRAAEGTMAPAPAPAVAAPVVAAMPPAAPVGAAPAAATQSRAADRTTALWTELLPYLVDGALKRGHVRAASLLYESALAAVDGTTAGAQVARQLLDGASQVDATMQRRQLAGEMVVVPSLTEARPSAPRFLVGLSWSELAHPAVEAFVRAELSTGADVELRNFLDQALQPHDAYLDLDPGMGAGLFTALTGSAELASTAAWSHDVTLATALERNVAAAGLTGEVALFTGAPASTVLTAQRGSRTVVHLGSQSVSLIGAALPTWRALPTVIAWRTEGAQARSVGEVLLNAGFEPFALTVGEGGFQLVPLARAREATYAFAISGRFADSIGAGA